MTKVLSRLFVVLCLVGVPALASAQDSGTAQSQIAAIIAQYPDGGQALSDAVAAAVEANPSLAAAVTQLALTATATVQTALGGGLAEAAVFFASSSSPNAQAAQQQIQAAIASAPASIVTAFNSGGGAAALLSTIGTSSTQLTTSNCVSPSRRGSGC
ncbi:MAG TPA: hypothetical protein VHW66_16795 [Stellaceae bacterium]|jgi:hypothetical protein|nr:hypothetical protein [Stellaceae bacterium]